MMCRVPFLGDQESFKGVHDVGVPWFLVCYHHPPPPGSTSRGVCCSQSRWCNFFVPHMQNSVARIFDTLPRVLFSVAREGGREGGEAGAVGRGFHVICSLIYGLLEGLACSCVA